jgi:hypothetical protein
MIEIALRRVESKVLASPTVMGRAQGEVDRGWQDKSADVRRAHVVGWVEVSRGCTRSLAGASHGIIKEIKSRSAIAHLEPISTPA